jgi:hypothetical protein
MPAGGVAERLVVIDDVGARQRPNTGANQRGRASVSSSAGNGGPSDRLGGERLTIEALLYTDDRARYLAMGIDPQAGRCQRLAPLTEATLGCRAASLLKSALPGSDQNSMTNPERLPVKAGPVPDKLTIWPVDDGRYGLDATFQGASGYERAEHHQQELQRRRVPHTFRQELGGGWTLRFGPLSALDVATALSAFVY